MEERYSRQTRFISIGKTGQELLNKKHVLIIGAGALGTGSAELFVRSGVGKVTIVDRDYVEYSNLQRQQLYTEEDAIRRLPKAIAAETRLKSINSSVKIAGRIVDVTAEEIEDLISGVDLIVDGTDNFETRLLINDAAQRYNIPWIYGACVGSYGITFTVIPGQTPCLSCILEKVPLGGETCDTVGVISPVVQMVVSYQAAEGLKLLVEDWQALRNTVVFFDLWKNDYASIKMKGLKRKNCPSCGETPTYPYLEKKNTTKTAVLCGRDTVQIRPGNQERFDLHQLAQRLSQHGKVESNPYLIAFTTGNHRIVVFQDGRVLIHGTKNEVEAKAIYHRYIGG